jgi:hypothetical protein
MIERVLITLRQPVVGEVEIIVSRNGVAAVYPLTLDQLKLIAAQSVRALCAWPEHAP